MRNKYLIFSTILFVLSGLTSYAQVRIEIVPPFIEGGGSPSWNENRNTPNSVSEDVFELKNGSTIRGNLESFSSGVYFVNIGGITKSIPENSILKINGQFLSSVRATVPDNMTADVKIVKLDINSFRLLFGGLQNTNRAILKNNKLIIDNDENVGYCNISENNEVVMKFKNGVWQSSKKGIFPLKVDSNGIFCLANDSMTGDKKNTNVYYYRFGANNLEGPVGKCDNNGGGGPFLYFARINSLGLTEIALPYGLDKILFCESIQTNNGFFSFKSKFSYLIRKRSDIKDYNGTISPRNGISVPIIGYGNFFNKNIKNWIVAYYNCRIQKVTKKKDSELYIDVFDENISKGVVKSFNFIIPPVSSKGSFGNNGNFFAAHCIDIDRDGITELVFEGDYDDESTKKAAIIVKLK